MSDTRNHYEKAERLLAEGAKVVQEIRDVPAAMPGAHSSEISQRRDELGKQAMGIWAQAQVHATLAVVEGHTP